MLKNIFELIYIKCSVLSMYYSIWRKVNSKRWSENMGLKNWLKWKVELHAHDSLTVSIKTYNNGVTNNKETPCDKFTS
jgi:serine protease inhibitor